jgi:hypothetical protein
MKEFEIMFHDHVPLVCNMYIPHQKVMAPQKIWHLYFMVDMLFSKMCLEIVEQMKQSSILVNVGSQVLLYVFPQ